tara:strand:- start:9464 stop:10210 length:747 start_codon:yes stop_codon:yes gene_type:complete
MIKKCALVYWGLQRSIESIYENHKKLHKQLDNLNIEYDTYFHSWKLEDTESQRVWLKEINIPIDYNSYKYLKPDKYNLTFKLDRQKDYSDTINIENYAVRGNWKYSKNNKKGLFFNHLCACESLKRSFSMVPENTYDYVIFIRPDQTVGIKEYELKQILQYLENTENGLCVPNKYSYKGYNDRFAIMNYKYAHYYANRIDEYHLYEPIKGLGGLSSEMIIKIIELRHNLIVKKFNIHLNLVRPDKNST